MPPTPDVPASRARTVKLWASTLMLVVLVGLAVMAGLGGYPFFAVASAVLAVFAAVELVWLLRRTPAGGADRSSGN